MGLRPLGFKFGFGDDNGAGLGGVLRIQVGDKNRVFDGGVTFTIGKVGYFILGMVCVLDCVLDGAIHVLADNNGVGFTVIIDNI